MVHFNELYVTEDGKHLVVEAEIDKDPVFYGCYIESIKISPVVDCSHDSQPEPITVYEDDGEHKTLYRLCLNTNDESVVLANISDFSALTRVIVTANSGSSNAAALASLDCGGWDNNTVEGAAYNGLPIYNSIINSIPNTGSCDVDLSSLEDAMLNYYGLQFALKCGEWCKAAEYYDWLVGSGTLMSGSSKHCGCHGTY